MRKSAAKPPPTYALIFSLRDPARIQFIHGRKIIEVVHHDIARRFAAIAKSVLRQHTPLSEPFCPEFGTWIVPFHMKIQDVAFDAAEQIAAMTEAGLELIHQMLDTELGRAAAMHSDFRFGVLCDESGETAGARLFQRLSPRLAELDRANRKPPVSRSTFRELLRGPGLHFQLQPIVSLDDLKPVGFEVLARGPAGGPVERADRLFATAAYYGLHRELDLACVAGAFRQAGRLPAPYWLSINLSPDLFDPAILKPLMRDHRDLRHQIFELTEHVPIPSRDRFKAASRSLRRHGARVALDDAGCGFLDLDHAMHLSPNIVKLCITAVRRITSGPSSHRAVRDVVGRIRKIRASPLAEGVETAGQLRHVRDCGFELAQGYLFGKPRPAADVLRELGR